MTMGNKIPFLTPETLAAVVKRRRPAKTTDLTVLAKRIREETGQRVKLEYVFAPPRRWRMDIALPDAKICVEIQGGLFIGGGHNRGAYMLQEHAKRNEAAARNWRLFYFTPKEAREFVPLAWIRRALKSSEVDSCDTPSTRQVHTGAS
jgi:hypothetical protein